MNTIVQLLLIFMLFTQGFDMKEQQKVRTIEGADLPAKWNAALKDAQSNYPQSLIWVGYSFKVRHGVGVEIVLEPGHENQNFLRLMVVAKNGDPMTPHLIEAIAMQDDPQADVTLKTLEQEFRGKVEGTMSTYWLRER